MDTFGKFNFTVRSYECSPNGCLTLANLCNYLQEAASVNAEELGFSKTNFDAQGKDITWVMTRMRVEALRLPKWGETVELFTYPRSGRRIVAYRDFAVNAMDGTQIARATSEWMMIDMSTRRPVAIPDFVFTLANDVRAPVFPDPQFAKFRWEAREGDQPAFETTALASDIDLNRHVNNVRYIVWAMETLAAVNPAIADAISMELVFRSETVAGEKVLGFGRAVSPAETLIRLASPSGEEHVLARFSAAQAQ